jgi:DNA-binding protein Fis
MYVYGYNEYSMIGSKYGNRELDEKQKMISFFKENPKALKTINYKITNSNIQEIFSEYLSFQNETTLLGVIGLAVFYNIRILLVDTLKKTYLDYNINNTNNKICVLFKNTGIRNRTKYTFDMYMTDEKIQTIQKSMLCLEHFNKPLRSISTYKTSELEDISKLLGIYNEELQKKLKKQELYNNISEYCGVF